ncbi:MAG TPA: hypothetical protein VKF61_11890 [Candidatus Polarisedimenticolia bacterium]|nr:hypothetical protein [Candidatus Polarisedimenticolia bacterium]
MNRITLNLASRPFRNNTIVGAVLAGAVATLIAATVYNGYVFLNYGGHYRALQNEERQHRERLTALTNEERTLSKQIQARDFRSLYGRGVFADNLILKRSFSWTLLFNRLEDLVPSEVMMTAVRPNISGEKTVIRVDGVARNHGGLLALEESLQKNPVFARVHPIYERRVNPSRPEIDFALEFDYFPTPSPPGPDAVASGGGPAAASPAPVPAAPTPTPSTIASAPPPGPASSAARPSATPGEGAARAAAPAAGPHQVIGTVGRDGRPRTPELLARVIAAPGGFYPTTPPEQEAAPPSKKPRGKPRDAAQSPARDSTRVVPTQAGAVSSRDSTAPSPSLSAGATQAATQPAPPPGAGTGSTATWQDGASPGAGRPGALARGRIPSPGAGRSSVRTNRGAGPKPPAPVPATRLDVPLKFFSRPVGDVYAALSSAHAVRIEIDPTVDQKARVTADLSGKSLAEAFASLSKLTGHKVLRVEEGIYRVVTLAGGEPLGDRSVQEEPLLGSEVKP